MKGLLKVFTAAALVAAGAMFGAANLQAAGHHPAVVTNNDLKGANSITFFKFTGTTLQDQGSGPTGGKGIGGGFPGLNRIVLGVSGKDVCGFVSDAGSGDIGVFKVVGKVISKVGNYKDAKGSGKANGIGLAVTLKYVFAAYTSTKNIGVFAVQSGCKLKLLGTYKAAGAIAGMRAAPNFKTLVVGYGSGVNKVDSFSIAANGKLTEHGPYAATSAASGVDITADSAYAVFGDTTSGKTQVEIYPINSDGSLGKDNNFGGDGSLGDGVGSSNVWLSVDEKFLFVSNNSSKQVTSLAFSESPSLSYINITTLNNPNNDISSTGGMTTVLPTGNGSYLAVAEDGSPDSFVGLLQINSDGSTTEVSGSPYEITGGGPGLQSLMIGPPRPF
jgi:6-phosphogluconolactonase (cycloisomerase 2 family)